MLGKYWSCMKYDKNTKITKKQSKAYQKETTNDRYLIGI